MRGTDLSLEKHEKPSILARGSWVTILAERPWAGSYRRALFAGCGGLVSRV